jgi:aerobic carbon-monoxide dehydrogenase large subunit
VARIDQAKRGILAEPWRDPPAVFAGLRERQAPDPDADEPVGA